MKIIVGMSGGVDSTVTAYLLKKEGHEVVGANFDFAKSNDKKDLEAIKNSLHIKMVYKDYIDEFRKKVISEFVNDYESGITPNPCALCNSVMKFEKLMEVMKEENADMVATGHYANVVRLNDTYAIRKSANTKKDQSYMLYRLNQNQLSHIIFPLGDMDKTEVKIIAKNLNLKIEEKKESQDICFVNKDIDYIEFIKRYEFGDNYKENIALGKMDAKEIDALPFFKKGEFVDLNGKVLGYHDGIINYTIGQRRGINIAFGERRFVCKIDAKLNKVVLGNNEDLFSDSLMVYDIVFSGISEKNFLENFKELHPIVKVRYRHAGTRCSVSEINYENGKLTISIKLDEKVRAITSGQAAVFYDEDDSIIFGGRIK